MWSVFNSSRFVLRYQHFEHVKTSFGLHRHRFYTTPSKVGSNSPSDRYKDSFRPTKAPTFSRTDQTQYNYTPERRHRDHQFSPVSRSNTYEGSRTYGRSGGYNSHSGRQQATLGSRLTPIDWDSEKLVPFEKKFYKEQPEVAKRTVEQIKQVLQEQHISINGRPPIPKPVMTFAEVGFPPYIQQEIGKAQFKEPSPIQKIGFPIALSGRDFVGISKTGSGKTLAFLLPAMIHIDAQPSLKREEGPIVLILAPTRELCLQIHETAANYGYSRQIRCTAVYGGSSRSPQESKLYRGTEIVVACPGRLLDFLENKVTNLKRTTFLILDEADRMLDMGFEPQIRKIVSQIRPDRQTLMYSATWPSSVNALAKDFCREEAVHVKIGNLELHANPDVTQKILIVNEHEKEKQFMDCISKTLSSAENRDAKPKILVFCSTRRLCDRVSGDLTNAGKGAVAIHGQKSQPDRDRAIREFKCGMRPILVATDVAARGLDITDVTAVVNYDLPNCIEDYVHRIGRTARGGKKGLSITFFPKAERSADSIRMAKEISKIMELAGQQVPIELLRHGQRYF